MKMIKAGLAGLFAAMLCFAVAGCGAGGGADDPKAAFIGSWTLAELSGENSASAEDIELMKSLGITVDMTLNEDGTGSLDLFGEVMDGEWSATSATQATLTLKGEAVDLTLADDKLSMTQDGAEMIFVKSAAASSSQASSAPAAASSATEQPSASSEPAAEASAESSAEPSAAAA